MKVASVEHHVLLKFPPHSLSMMFSLWHKKLELHLVAFCFTLKLSFLHGALVTFSGEWCKESKIWTAGVFIVQLSSVQSLSCVWLFATSWTAAHQPSLSISNSWSLLKLMSIESVMPLLLVGCSCFYILSKEIGYRIYLYIYNCPSLLTEVLFSQ